MPDPDTSAASNAHRRAAANHAACAQHHSLAALCYEQNKLDHAKLSAAQALDSAEMACKQSAIAYEKGIE
ncbi:MAG TPA: hypothetical protein VIE17_06750 [Methylophilaceae bacterium]|jgi:hypothetical protein